MPSNPNDIPGSTPSRTEFRDDQMRAVYSLGAENHYWCLARNRVVQRQVARLLGEGKGGVLFDIGCGRGFTIAHLAQAGYECHGSDLADYSPEHPGATGRVHYGVELDGVPAVIRERTSLLLVLDVLEHLPAPEQLLSTLPGLFPAARWLVVTVPARQELWSNYDEFYGHHRRYAPKGLHDLARDSGLQLHSWGYFFHGLYLPALMARYLAGGRSTKVEVAQKSIFHHFIASALFAEHMIVPGFVPGSSLLGVFDLKPQSR